MKQVYFNKDNYKDNTVKVSYFERDALRTTKVLEVDEETGKIQTVLKEQKYNKHLFCQRLEWAQDERELDDYIEEMRVYWEGRINS